MKNKKKIIFIIITSIILIGIICSLISGKVNVIKEKQVIKEMSESTQITDLNNQITALNTSHDEYAKNVQAYKTKIAEAITNQGVPTSADAKTEVIVDNIGKILQEKTIATATAAQILSGQTAWVNGSKITGTMVDKGKLNWAPTTSTTYTVPAGYYSGGTLNSSGAYNTGFNNGVTAADNRANGNSVNYQTGYNNGYNAGYNAGSGKISQLTCLNFTSSSTSFYVSNTYSHCYVIVSMAQPGGFAGNYWTPSVTNGTLIAQNSVAKSYDGITNGAATYIFEISPVTAGSTITVSTGMGDYYALGTIYVYVG